MFEEGGDSAARGSTWSLGSPVAGIPIRIHYSFFLLLGIELFSILGYGSKYFFLIFLLYGPILFITVVVHELGHALTTQKLGGDVDGIVLWPLGGFALCGPTNAGVIGDFKVAIAGPLTHIPMSLLWLLLYSVFSGGNFSHFSRVVDLSLLRYGGVTGFLSILCAQAVYFNIMLMVFNLFIPAYPLDGGRCLGALLVICGVPVSSAALITSVTGMVIACGMGVLGIIDYMQGNSTGLFLALIAIFIANSSKDLFLLTRSGRLNEHPIFGRDCYAEQQQQSSSVSQYALISS